MLSGGYWEQARRNDTDDLFRKVAPLLADADVAVGNLEGPLTERASAGPPWKTSLTSGPNKNPERDRPRCARASPSMT